MNNKLYIIGNGFDLAHNLPTRFDPDFKSIANHLEPDNFWELYQSTGDEIWSDFEYLLASPDFNLLEEILAPFWPDYQSDYERDRNGIIIQVDLVGHLNNALDIFAEKANDALNDTKSISFFNDLLDTEGFYLTFNYTQTLEEIYGISSDHILHIHGEVGDDLILGYPEGTFEPAKYCIDVRGKGNGPYVEYDIEDYIDTIEDYYISTAFKNLLDKCKSFYKETDINSLEDFLNENQCKIEEIFVYGHSCGIDYEYFEFLSNKYPRAKWVFYYKGQGQKCAMTWLSKEYKISKYELRDVDKYHISL